MILGTGLDVVSLARIRRLWERHGERLARHLLTPLEQFQAASLTDPVPRLAGRFAAKEAVMKALGTGWGGGVNFTQIEVVNDSGGRPTVTLSGAALARYRQLGGGRWHLSIAHCVDVAVAQAILEAEEGGRGVADG